MARRNGCATTAKRSWGLRLGTTTRIRHKRISKAHNRRRECRTHTLLAFGAGVGPNDLFFFFFGFEPRPRLGHRNCGELIVVGSTEERTASP